MPSRAYDGQTEPASQFSRSLDAEASSSRRARHTDMPDAYGRLGCMEKAERASLLSRYPGCMNEKSSVRLGAVGRRLQLLSVLALGGCAAPSNRPPSTEARPHIPVGPADAARPPAAASASPAVAEAPGKAEGAASGSLVRIEPEPSCGPSVGASGPATGEGAQSRTWLDKPGVRERGAALQQELTPYASETLGWYPDHVRQAVVVVFHTTFTAYEEVRRKLERVVSPLAVVLRPACYPPERIAAAREVLERADWHPRAKSFRVASHLDPSFSGFVVTIDESAPDVAAALEQRLGPLVEVRLGKPHG